MQSNFQILPIIISCPTETPMHPAQSITNIVGKKYIINLTISRRHHKDRYNLHIVSGCVNSNKLLSLRVPINMANCCVAMDSYN